MKLTLCTAAIALAMATFPLQATIVITAEGGGTGVNVLFNEDDNGQDGEIVGTTNQGGWEVLFSSSSNLFAPSTGQSRVESNQTLTDLNITWLNFFGTDETIFNINAAADGSVTLSGYDEDNNLFQQTFDLDASGENFFRFSTLDDQLITRITISSTVDIQDVKQVRLGEVFETRPPGEEPIPEPSTYAMMAGGVLAVVAARKKFGTN